MLSQWFRRWSARPSRQPRPRLPHARRFRPSAESLERRDVPAPFNFGDVVLGLADPSLIGGGGGFIKHYDAQGNFIETIKVPGSTGVETGLAFDAARNLYVTNFFDQTISKFDRNGNYVGTFGSGYTGSVESIVFDTAGSAYVGAADTNVIRKFDPAGNPLAAYTVKTGARGTDWITLASDQHTVYYTSEDNSVYRYDLNTNTQLPDFVTNLPGTSAFALRFLSGECGQSTGQLLVADSEQIVRLNEQGQVIQTYNQPPTDPVFGNVWFALNIDPDGTSFWSADTLSGRVTKFDIASGAVLETFNAGSGVGGVAVVGEIAVPHPEQKVQEQVTYYATGADAGGGPEVKVYNAATNQLKFDFMAYDPRFTGGVRVATGDVNGDGFPDIITAPGPGGGPNVRVFSGKDLSLLSNFMAYDPRFRGGVFVASGDLTNAGHADIVTGPDAGGGPNVRIFDGAGKLLNSYMAFNPRFSGGIHVAAGDVNDDGNTDVVVGAGAGGGPSVAVFSSLTGTALSSFFAYDPRFTGGVYVGTGKFDLASDPECPKFNIITGPGIGGGADVRVFDGLTGQILRLIQATPQGFINFSDGQSAISGARVSAIDYNGVKPDDILVAYGAPTTAELNVYSYGTGRRTNSFFAYSPLFSGGIFVASGHF